jgi:hypothetical protein
MAETTTTRPRRSRVAASTTAAKPATTKSAPVKAEAEAKAAKTEVTRFTVALEHGGTTKSYEKFVVPESFKGTVVGSIYAPIGTERVGIVVIGAGDAEEAPAE